jgi:hypothetical protein
MDNNHTYHIILRMSLNLMSVVYLTMPLTAQTLESQVVGWLVNEAMQRICTEGFQPNLM